MADIETNSRGQEIYSRQSNLIAPRMQDAALVIGLGGIGNWAAIDCALYRFKTIYIFDNDTIETSNLNRTLFRLSDIGRPKVDAVEELIYERRPDVTVLPFNRKFTIEDYKKYCESGVETYIFDCTDTNNVKEALRDYLNQSENLSKIADFKYVKMGYDGVEGTISMNDLNSGMWGEDSPYTVVPSFFGTPQVLSALGVTMLVNTPNYSITETFDINLLLDYVHRVKQGGHAAEQIRGIQRPRGWRPVDYTTEVIQSNSNIDAARGYTMNSDTRRDELRRMFNQYLNPSLIPGDDRPQFSEEEIREARNILRGGAMWGVDSTTDPEISLSPQLQGLSDYIRESERTDNVPEELPNNESNISENGTERTEDLP